MELATLASTRSVRFGSARLRAAPDRATPTNGRRQTTPATPHFSPGRFSASKELMGFKKFDRDANDRADGGLRWPRPPALRAEVFLALCAPCYPGRVHTGGARTCSLNRSPRYAFGREHAHVPVCTRGQNPPRSSRPLVRNAGYVRQCSVGGTSMDGFRSKKPVGFSVKPAYSTGITGQSSGRGTWVTPRVCQTTTSVSSTDRFAAA